MSIKQVGVRNIPRQWITGARCGRGGTGVKQTGVINMMVAKLDAGLRNTVRMMKLWLRKRGWDNRDLVGKVLVVFTNMENRRWSW